jgi:hypothetical protein
LCASKSLGSVLFTDNGGGLSLSYYFCHQRVIQYELPFQPFLQSNCNGLHVVTPAPNFKTLPDRSALSAIDPDVGAKPTAQTWFFQAGWIAGKEDMRRTCRRLVAAIPESSDILLFGL